LRVKLTGITGAAAGVLVITGLPYVVNNAPSQQAVTVGEYTFIQLPATMVNLKAYAVGGVSNIRLVGGSSTTPLASILLDASLLAATSGVSLAGSYVVA